ncbi:MAG: type II secretion system protein GspL [Hyphomonas sp.]|nr:type II secretion system protein GspL [Hyphomonas sp.]
MKADLYIELPSDPGAPLRIARRRGERLEPVSAEGFRVSGEPKAVAFAPALAVARFNIPLAAKSESEARRAALFAIEDELAQSIDDAHLTLGPRDRTQTMRTLYVIDKQLLDAWISQLTAIGAGHAEIVPESSLALASGTVLDFGDRILLSGAAGVVGADPSWPDEAIRELISASGLGSVVPTKADALEALSKLHSAFPGIRLQNTLDTRSSQTFRQRLKPWATAGVLATAAALIWIASIWMETAFLQRLAQQSEASAVQMFRAQFPAAPDPVDIHADVRRLSQQIGPGAAKPFHSLSSGLYAAVAESGSARLGRLSYASADEALTADLVFSNRAQEAAFIARLERSGFRAEITVVQASPDGVSATVLLRTAP